SHTQLVKVSDTEVPVFVEDLPASELEVSCDVIPVPIVLTATDNCDTNITVNYSETIKNQETGCSSNYVIERIWEVSDCSGNSTTHTQLVKVNDTEAPVFVEALPASELEVSCDAIPVPVVLTATDNCDTNITVNYSEAIKNEDAGCSSNYVIERVWEVSDCSGNSSSHTQLVKVNDTEAPVFVEALPASELEVSCDAIPAPVVLNATDNCDTNITVNYSEAIKNEDAGCSSNYMIERVWEVSDCSGNSSSYTQLVKVNDTEAPVFVEALPASELEVSCDAIPAPVVLTATDNCDTNITVNYSEGIKNQDAVCSSNYVIERVWEVSDCSGNSSSHTQLVKVSDTEAPELVSSLQDMTITCNEILDVPDLVFQDNCSQNVTQIDFTETNTFDGTGSDYQIIREWTVKDDCDNTAVFTQKLTVTIEVVKEEFDETVVKCITDGDINLNDYLIDQNTNGTWEVTVGEAIITNGIFDPLNSDLGAYEFTYTSVDNGCIKAFSVNVVINEDCGVFPCGRNDVKISKVVTPNQDQWNEYFEVVDECSFIADVQLFNRWGTKIYESKDYKNNWNGLATNTSFGGSKYLPAGTYYYIVVLKDSGLKPFTGAIYLGTK
ncbi:gliding motility-associated C-terminal domain-containing protein, partial [Tenacibaculum agarivorans]|uniref:gliding motility-associated C-terminal domain-containing protein n=1 Tax=Tenacibaculum agarivorans TaxID=1908389 RepID=UPI000A6A7240